MIKYMIVLVQILLGFGCLVAWEHPLRASSWQLPEVIELCKVMPFKVHTDGCCYNMRSIDTNELVLKSWRIQCTTAEQASRLDLRCQGNHVHTPLEGGDRVNATSYYPLPMVKRWVRGLMKPQSLQHIAASLCHLDCGDMPAEAGATHKNASRHRMRKLRNQPRQTRTRP